MRSILQCLGLAVVALGLAACGNSAPATRQATVATDPATGLPIVDINKVRAAAEGASDVLVLEMTRDGSRTVRGRIEGDSGPAYAVAVAQGQPLRVMFRSGISAATFNVVDVAKPAEAVHRGEVQGNTAVIPPGRATTYVIVPFQMRSGARRAAVANYNVTVHRN